MDRESTRRLKMDRRLIRRRGWLSADELERELAALPDVSHKIAPPEGEPTAPSGETQAPPAEAPEESPEI